MSRRARRLTAEAQHRPFRPAGSRWMGAAVTCLLAACLAPNAGHCAGLADLEPAPTGGAAAVRGRVPRVGAPALQECVSLVRASALQERVPRVGASALQEPASAQPADEARDPAPPRTPEASGEQPAEENSQEEPAGSPEEQPEDGAEEAPQDAAEGQQQPEETPPETAGEQQPEEPGAAEPPREPEKPPAPEGEPGDSTEPPGPPEKAPTPYGDVYLTLGYQGVRVSGSGPRFRQYRTPATGFVAPLLALERLSGDQSLRLDWWQPADSDQTALLRWRDAGPWSPAFLWAFSRFTFHPGVPNQALPLTTTHFGDPVWRTEYQAEGAVLRAPNGTRLAAGYRMRSVVRSPRVFPYEAWRAGDLYAALVRPLGAFTLGFDHETRRFTSHDQAVSRTRSTSSGYLRAPIGGSSAVTARFGHTASNIPEVAGFVPGGRVAATFASVDGVAGLAPGLSLRGRWRQTKVTRGFVGNGYLRKLGRSDVDLSYRPLSWLLLRAGLGHHTIDFVNRAGRLDEPRLNQTFVSLRARPSRSLTLGVDYRSRRLARNPPRPPEDIGGSRPIDLSHPDALAPLAPDRRVRWEFRADWLPTPLSLLSASFITEDRRNRLRAVDHDLNLLNLSYWSSLTPRLSLTASYTRQTFGTGSEVLRPWLSGASHAQVGAALSTGGPLDLTADWIRYRSDGAVRVSETLVGVGARWRLPDSAHVGVQLQYDTFGDRIDPRNGYRALVLGVEGGTRF